MGYHFAEKILIAAGAACLIYYLTIVVYAGITADFAWFWAALGVLMTAAGLLIRGGIAERMIRKIPGAVTGCVVSVLIVGIIVWCSLLISIIGGMQMKTEKTPEYLIVLGAQVRGEQPSRALKKRLDHALGMAEKYPDMKLILSGGKGSGESISEAECMKRYLTERSVPEERLILEDHSTSTTENLQFSMVAEPACETSCTGILSNNFHVYRAVEIAKRFGYKDVFGVPAPSDPVMQVHYVVRETFALLNEYRKGNIIHPIQKKIMRLLS